MFAIECRKTKTNVSNYSHIPTDANNTMNQQQELEANICNLTAVKREKFAKNKKTTSKERASLLLFKFDTLPVSC